MEEGRIAVGPDGEPIPWLRVYWDGRIQYTQRRGSRKAGDFITPFLVGGRPFICCQIKRKHQRIEAHRLVLRTFLDNPGRMHPIDDDWLNLSVSNWAEGYGNRTFTEGQEKVVRERIASGQSVMDACADMPGSYTTWAAAMKTTTRKSKPTRNRYAEEIPANWRDVVGYEGLYEVSDMGQVKSHKRVLAGYNRRRQVTLTKDGRPKGWILARLVAAAFIGPCPEGWHVDHLSGDPTDDRLCNLEYVTPEENNRRYKVTKFVRGLQYPL